jgi:DMSO/TMAO reductase YedYZ heme-binding membrane subunit
MTLSSNSKNLAVFIATAVVLGVPSVLLVVGHQAAEEYLLLVLRALGRISFVIFLLIVAIRPLRQLVASPLTATLLRNRRYVGIALAAAMTVHLGFIAWRYAFVRGENLDFAAYLTGGLFYSMLYLMLLTSFNAPAAALGAKRWRMLHKTGFWTLAVFFAYTFRNDIVKIPHEPMYFLLALLALLAAGTRLLAYAKQRRGVSVDAVTR